MESNIVKETNREADDTAAYEDARVDKGSEKNPKPVSDSDVESVNIRINPDADTLDRG